MGGGAADRLSSPLDSVTTSREIVDGLSCLTSSSIDIPGILSLAEPDVPEIRARAYPEKRKGQLTRGLSQVSAARRRGFASEDT